MSIVLQLFGKGLISRGDLPAFLPASIQYEAIMGSQAYGCAADDSDRDIYGWCIPDKEYVFPHLQGCIPGFGRKPKTFDQWQMHHIADPAEERSYDCTIFSIAKYFSLALDNNPNMVDSLFTPEPLVAYQTKIGQMVRERRRLFLHKGCWPKFRGYAYQQIHKMRTKNPEGARREMIEKYGYDVKFASHTVRLLDEAEQILTEGDLDLTRSVDRLRSIRSGEWTVEQIERYFEGRAAVLEAALENSVLPDHPNEKAAQQLLIDCLEEHFKDLSDCPIALN